MWSDPPAIDLSASPYSVVIAAAYGLLLAAGTVTALVVLLKWARAPPPWPLFSQSLINRPWTWRDGGIILGFQVLLILIAALASSLFPSADPPVMMITETLLFDGVGLLFLHTHLKRRGIPWHRAFGNPFTTLSQSFRMGARFYLALLPMIVFASLVIQILLSANGYPPSIQDVATLLSADHPFWIRAYMVVLAVVLAPAFEECLFRGLALPLLARHLGLGPAVLATSLVFALVHFHLSSFAPLCIMAAAFSLAYLYSGSLWVPIVMHGLFNGVNVAILTLLNPSIGTTP